MSKVTAALWTLLWLIVAFVIYKYGFNPQIVIASSLKNASKCPERWTVRDQLCHPDYKTTCIPFDPSKLRNIAEACSIAKRCQTDWSNMCL